MDTWFCPCIDVLIMEKFPGWEFEHRVLFYSEGAVDIVTLERTEVNRTEGNIVGVQKSGRKLQAALLQFIWGHLKIFINIAMARVSVLTGKEALYIESMPRNLAENADNLAKPPVVQWVELKYFYRENSECL